MDLNYLLARHQVALFNAENATNDEARRAHQVMVNAYAARIVSAKCPAAPLTPSQWNI
jgi:hypothetical protein